VRFNDRVLCSHYDIEEADQDESRRTDNLMLSVYQKMIEEDR
jgi:hypothetical protein